MDKNYVFVVNPNGANGSTGKEWNKLFPKLVAKLGKDCTVKEAFTSAPTHAIEITREAIKNGADIVVAVGGDGTLHEVVNGFFENGKPVHAEDNTGIHRTALGLVPLGTGSDFARTFGWNNNPLEAFNRIAKGQRQKIDVGFAKTNKDNGGRYFVNVADIHLSAKAGYHAAKYKRFGNLCYVLGALQAFMSHRNQDLSIRLDEGDWIQAPQVTSIAVGNAKYFGGGMKITPGVTPFSRNFEMVTLQNFKWFDFVLHLNKLYNGTHLSVDNVSSQRTQTIEIKETPESKDLLPKGNVYVQTDGEHIGFLPATFSIIPEAIDMIV